MADQTPKQALGPGGLIAICIAVGTGIGVAYGQPSLGLIGGVLCGATISLILFLLDRQR